MGYALYFCVLILALLFIPFSTQAAEGAAEGARLFALSVFPALFPFLVCSRYLLKGRPAKKLLFGGGKAAYAFTFFASVLFGTPTSALIARELYASEICSRKKASVICAAFNLSSPGFVIASLARGIAGDTSLAYIFAFSHYVPAFAAALIFTFAAYSKKTGKATSVSDTVIEKGAGSPSLIGAVSEAVTAILRVGGTIVFFKAAYSVLDSTGVFGSTGAILRGVLSGAVEFTGGLQLTASVPGRAGAAASAFVLSFGGVCLFVQSKLFFEELASPEYFITKLMMGLASAGAAWLLFPAMHGTAAVFGSMTEALGSTPVFDPARLSALVCGGISVLFSVLVILTGSKALRLGTVPKYGNRRR